MFDDLFEKLAHFSKQECLSRVMIEYKLIDLLS